MNKKYDKHSVEKALNDICRHPYFEKSPRNVRLLQFLVTQALNEVDVKEQTIGLELFAESFDPENNDGKVRVYMYNLRKKLEEYYSKFGKNDDVVFKIEKGQYNISFSNQKDLKTERAKSRSKFLSGKAALIFLMACFIVFGAKLLLPTKNYYCWNDFFDSGANNLCIVADHYMVEKQQTAGNWLAMRVPEINSDVDLLDYVQAKDDQTIRSANYGLMSKMAPFTVFELSNWFFKHNTTFSLAIESDFRHEDTRNHNILYVGQFKTMNVSKGIFLRNSKCFSVYQDGFKFTTDSSEVVYITSIKNQNRIEYAMVSYVKLDNDNKALFFTSNHDIGTMATVRNFTDYKWLKTFYKSLPEDTKYYNALFEVTGLERTEMSCKLIKLERVNMNE